MDIYPPNTLSLKTSYSLRFTGENQEIRPTSAPRHSRDTVHFEHVRAETSLKLRTLPYIDLIYTVTDTEIKTAHWALGLNLSLHPALYLVLRPLDSRLKRVLLDTGPDHSAPIHIAAKSPKSPNPAAPIV